jgi:hypothetical protein
MIVKHIRGGGVTVLVGLWQACSDPSSNMTVGQQESTCLASKLTSWWAEPIAQRTYEYIVAHEVVSVIDDEIGEFCGEVCNEVYRKVLGRP